MAAVMFLIDRLVPEGVLSFSWATVAVTAGLVLDVSTEMGEYFRLLQNEPVSRARREERRKIVRDTALSTSGTCLMIFFVTGVIIGLLTRGMDHRMYDILHGFGSLEAALMWGVVSIYAPHWVGLYHSPTKNSYVKNRQVVLVDDDRGLERFVRWSLVHLFALSYFLILPFVGKMASFFTGAVFGFCIDFWLYIARRRGMFWKQFLTYFLAVDLAVCSAGFFADGCAYIQTVWNIKYIRSEQGLAIGAYAIWLVLIGLVHLAFYRQTQRILKTSRRISVAARGERLATSLIFSKIQGHRNFRPSSLGTIEEDAEAFEDAFSEQDAIVRDSKTDTQGSKEEEDLEEDHEDNIKLQAKYDCCLNVLWYTVAFLSMLMVVANVGATFQMNRVRDLLPLVDALLYNNMNGIPVCGLDIHTKEVQTFATPQDAHAAGYGVAHCGACGACSSWHNLRLQYTTRTYLADESAKCARKSLYGGRNASYTCLIEDPLIGFEPECADCWTDDILCSKEHCAFIFLQSLFINTIGNFEVSSTDITSATCEEAFCEMNFVPCSGATRRRMDIHSDIKRPKKQQCTTVDFDWEQVFAEEDDQQPQELELLGAPLETSAENSNRQGFSTFGVMAGLVGLLTVIAAGMMTFFQSKRQYHTVTLGEASPLTGGEKRPETNYS